MTKRKALAFLNIKYADLIISTLPYTLKQRKNWVNSSKSSIEIDKEFELYGSRGVAGKYCWSNCSYDLLYEYHGNIISIDTFNSIFSDTNKLINFLNDLLKKDIKN